MPHGVLTLKFKLLKIRNIQPDKMVFFTRFIRSDRKPDIFGEHFEPPKKLISTFKVQIVTRLQQNQAH